MRTLATPNSAPASVTTALGVAASLIIYFGHLSDADATWLTGLAGGIGTLCVVIAGALAGKPVSMQVLTGALTVIFTALVMPQLHWDSQQVAGLAAATAVVLGFVLHVLHVTVTQAPAPPAAHPPARHELARKLAAND